MGRTCGEPDEIELTAMGVELYGCRRVPDVAKGGGHVVRLGGDEGVRVDDADDAQRDQQEERRVAHDRGENLNTKKNVKGARTCEQKNGWYADFGEMMTHREGMDMRQPRDGCFSGFRQLIHAY